MTVTIRGENYECRTATKVGNRVTLYLGEYDERGNEMTSVFIDFPDEDIVGLPETEHPGAPTLEDRVGTLETDTADLTEALALLLSGVTE